MENQNIFIGFAHINIIYTIIIIEITVISCFCELLKERGLDNFTAWPKESIG